jgi:hypothetical protein
MGLDIYLCGVPADEGLDIIRSVHEEQEDCEQIGYWRKHRNLHKFVVNEFAGGVDECQRIDLTIDDIENIILAVKTDSIPDTYALPVEVDYSETLEILNQARAKILENPGYRVYYRASW